MKQDLQVGDLAIAQNSIWAENNGRIVLILRIDRARDAPYLVREIARRK